VADGSGTLEWTPQIYLRVAVTPLLNGLNEKKKEGRYLFVLLHFEPDHFFGGGPDPRKLDWLEPAVLL
jgi:hypothetical protein